ncbi:MAG: hypothetical protein HYW34_01665 [Candidatus Brennerbacteria bacterium]|nr:hypothetical protein [Candidatus Brennerbacteria bacterium]
MANNKFVKPLFIFAVLVVAAGVYFWFSGRSVDIVNRQSVYKPTHLYGNNDVSIEKIKLMVFYAVPGDRSGLIYGKWREIMKKPLEKISDFHKLQFHGGSEIDYEIYPKPVILENSGSFYDSNNNGNAKALKLVAEELEKRAFKKNGDLYLENFAVSPRGDYPVLGIIYEGFGAIGGVIEESGLESEQEFAKLKNLPESVIFKTSVESANGFFLLSRGYLSEPEFEFYGQSFLYHEFAHTFGVQDYYDHETGLAFSDDIMGAGRWRSLESNFISSDILKELGAMN